MFIRQARGALLRVVERLVSRLQLVDRLLQSVPVSLALDLLADLAVLEESQILPWRLYGVRLRAMV